MKIGLLRHKIAIQQKVTSRDSYGAETFTWADVSVTWASIEPLSGREYFLAQQLQEVVDSKISLRYQSGIQPDMRVLWNSREFNIKAIINKEERNEEMMLMCQEQILKTV